MSREELNYGGGRRMKRSSSDVLLCSTCDKRFKYLSKYKRHLLSASHQRFEESLNLQSSGQDLPTDDSSTIYGSALFSLPPHPDTDLIDQRKDREVNVVAS